MIDEQRFPLGKKPTCSPALYRSHNHPGVTPLLHLTMPIPTLLLFHSHVTDTLYCSCSDSCSLYVQFYCSVSVSSGNMRTRMRVFYRFLATGNILSLMYLLDYGPMYSSDLTDVSSTMWILVILVMTMLKKDSVVYLASRLGNCLYVWFVQDMDWAEQQLLLSICVVHSGIIIGDLVFNGCLKLDHIVCICRELVLHGEDTASQIENGLHLPTFTSDAHGNLRTKIETGKRCCWNIRVNLNK